MVYSLTFHSPISRCTFWLLLIHARVLSQTIHRGLNEGILACVGTMFDIVLLDGMEDGHSQHYGPSYPTFILNHT